MSSARPRVNTVRRPRLTVFHVLHRVWVRILEIQVWDVAATMTFYAVLSWLPGSVAIISVLSLLGIEEETVHMVGTLVRQIFPTVDPRPYEQTLLALTTTDGGVLGLLLGTVGALLSTSNGVAAYHRTLHTVYDTREGLPFLPMRARAFLETIVGVVLVIVASAVMLIGNEASAKVGEYFGISSAVFEAWSLLKWPILLIIITLMVSYSYFAFPNVQLPYYRVMSIGSMLSVATLFGAAVLLGWLFEVLARFSTLLSTINSLIAILVIVWVACMVIIAGAIVDAEFLRARQIALGFPAWSSIHLDPQHTRALDYFERDDERHSALAKQVARSALTGEPLSSSPSLAIVDASSLWAVNPRKLEESLRRTGQLPVITDEQADRHSHRSAQ